MVRAKIDLRHKARELRKQGKSYNEIKNELGVSKGSISSWVKDIELTEEQQLKLVEYRGKRIHSSEENEKARIRMKQMWVDGKMKMCVNPVNGHLVFNKYELYAKPYIEERFDCNNFKPEYVEKHFFDFCNEKYIIELTFVPCGVTNAIRRFKNIQYDTRKRIIIGPTYYVGEKRFGQMNELDIEYIPLWFDKP